MKEITLTQGKIALVDDEDFDFLNKFKWYAQKDRYTYYALRRDGKKRMKMHRVVLGITDPQLFPDHEDHNGLNNQKSNLRIATRSQNAANIKRNIKCSSQYLGVSKMGKRWQVHIVKGGIQTYIGLFKNETDAALAYNKKAIEMHGEFANLNKITA